MGVVIVAVAMKGFQKGRCADEFPPGPEHSSDFSGHQEGITDVFQDRDGQNELEAVVFEGKGMRFA